jgi:hypothetical protein
MPDRAIDPMFSSLAVTVDWFTETDDVTWSGHDGKPRCARHPWRCLVKARAIGLDADGHLCATCMREFVHDE